MSWIVSSLTGQKIPDSQCGFRLIRREVLAQVPLRAKRFEIETELVLAAARQKWKTISVPISTVYRSDEKSHIRPLRDLARFLCVIAWHMAGQNRPSRK
jgi:hypothetical protein